MRFSINPPLFHGLRGPSKQEASSLVRWGNVRHLFSPVESALWAATCHKGVKASTAHPGGQTIGASPPPQKLQPPGKSTVALINVGMWFGMKTGIRPSVVVTNVKCREKKQGCLRAQLPFANICCFFMAQDPPAVPRRSVSEAQRAGFSYFKKQSQLIDNTL